MSNAFSNLFCQSRLIDIIYDWLCRCFIIVNRISEVLEKPNQFQFMCYTMLFSHHIISFVAATCISKSITPFAKCMTKQSPKAYSQNLHYAAINNLSKFIKIWNIQLKPHYSEIFNEIVTSIQSFVSHKCQIVISFDPSYDKAFCIGVWRHSEVLSFYKLNFLCHYLNAIILTIQHTSSAYLLKSIWIFFYRIRTFCKLILLWNDKCSCRPWSL